MASNGEDSSHPCGEHVITNREVRPLWATPATNNATLCVSRAQNVCLERTDFRGAWVAQSVKRPTSAQAVILQFVSLSPVSSPVLTAQSLEAASDSVSVSLPHPSLLYVSLSNIKHKKKNFLNVNIIFCKVTGERGPLYTANRYIFCKAI